MIRLFLAFVFIGALAACSEQTSQWPTEGPYKLRFPAAFGKMNVPEDNQVTQLHVLLGRIFFYDKRLSEKEDRNCATCHVSSAAFTDGQRVNTAFEGHALFRNTPTLANVGFAPYFMAEGGVPNLELQGLAPLHNSHEMGSNMMLGIERLNKDKALLALVKKAYQRDSIDPWVITRALASFQRTFISADSRYDRHQLGMENQLSEQEQLGMNLFFSEKTMCASCHTPPFFTDFGFYNIGLYQHYGDPGLERKTHLVSDSGKFKTPTLRNIDLTGPYMHDGTYQSLDDVVRFFNSGGKGHNLQDPRVKPLQLTSEECDALVAFLKTLTDYNFVQNTSFLPLNNE